LILSSSEHLHCLRARLREFFFKIPVSLPI
jgi:hypothetical protein